MSYFSKERNKTFHLEYKKKKTFCFAFLHYHNAKKILKIIIIYYLNSKVLIMRICCTAFEHI